MFFQDKKKESCVACRACMDICPKNCISMQEDSEGFFYPVINEETCIHCHLCETVCPTENPICERKDAEAWIGIHSSEDVIQKSSSGGAFTAIYEHLLSLGFLIYGVKFDENFKIKHAVAKTAEECKEFRKSKYVLSDTDHCYQKIKKNLQEEQKVLFTGTPCQCAALLNFLKATKVNTNNLITVDLVCHGAPSQPIFNSYLKELQGKEQSNITEFSFKNKSSVKGNINSRSAKIVFSNNKTKIVTAKDDPFLKAYYSRLFYRPSCGVCSFAQIHRISDLTLGDAWGVEKLYPQYNSLSGVSLILANTDKGKEILHKINHPMTLLPTTIEWAEQSNQQLQKPTNFHKKRNVFFEKWKEVGFYKSVEIATKKPFIQRVLRKIYHMLKKNLFSR